MVSVLICSRQKAVNYRPTAIVGIDCPPSQLSMHINSRVVVPQQLNRLHYCRYKPTVNKVHAVSHSEGGDDASDSQRH